MVAVAPSYFAYLSYGATSYTIILGVSVLADCRSVGGCSIGQTTHYVLSCSLPSFSYTLATLTLYT